MTATVLSSLNSALERMLREDESVVILGEDLLDPYGGAFKVTRGLSAKFPGRVLTTPVSESGFAGVAAGMAMRGLRPIVEIMFGDFLMLASDQLLNYISKCQWIYNGQASVPLVIRTPMGGRRGYGPTHSQSLEKHFIGMPGLTVVAANAFCDPGELLRNATLADPGPVLFIEHKLLYARPLRLAPIAGRLGDLHARRSSDLYPTVTLSFDPFQKADVTLVAYSYMAELAEQAAQQLLMEEEIFCEIVVPARISPLDLAPVLDSLQRSGALIVCEEGTQTAGWGAEVIAGVSAESFSLLRYPPQRVAARDLPIAASRRLEAATLPQVEDIVAAARSLVSHSKVPAI
jgi:pyruvate/2-oxoglutarate/acetoin dehydrogenase E1 component